jgi:aspartyl-tRNA(Asn)/glutamyl-tRNA(Gln) amidotransferase subunit A
VTNSKSPPSSAGFSCSDFLLANPLNDGQSQLLVDECRREDAMSSRRDFIKSSLVAGAVSGLCPPTFAQSNDLSSLSLEQASELVRKKTVSPVELTRSCLERINRLNPKLNAFILVTAEQAMTQARKAEREVHRGFWRGPLHGIPIGLKDNIDTGGIKTTLASAVFKDRVPSEDAEVVRRLKAAGAVLLGKQNLHEVAFGTTAAVSHFGPVHNPWSIDHIAGGSSGGSAAAIAADLCFGAVATDAGGSIRVPSNYCGIVGVKPTYGLVGMRGAGDEGWWSMNHVGPICRTVTDAALMLSVIAGYDPRDRTSTKAQVPNYSAALRRLNVSALRIGVPRAVFFDRLDPEIEAAINKALEVLRRLPVSEI